MGATASGTMAVSSAGSAYAQAQATKMQGEYQKQMYELNQRMAKIQARDALKRGESEAKALEKDTKRLIGSQRAGFAAQGVDVEDGSALEVQEDTAMQSGLDQMTIRNNAWREAWGFRAQANSYQAQAGFASLAARNNARNTLVTGGLQSISYGADAYYRYKKG